MLCSARSGVGFTVDFNIINAVQQGQIPGRELEFVHRDLVAFFSKLVYEAHRQRVNDNAVVNLNHQLRLVEKPGVFFIKSVVVKVMKFKRTL